TNINNFHVLFLHSKAPKSIKNPSDKHSYHWENCTIINIQSTQIFPERFMIKVFLNWAQKTKPYLKSDILLFVLTIKLTVYLRITRCMFMISFLNCNLTVSHDNILVKPFITFTKRV